MTRRYLDAAHLDDLLRARPTGHAEPTDQDRYYDSGPVYGHPVDPDDEPPWTDTYDDREAEL